MRCWTSVPLTFYQKLIVEEGPFHCSEQRANQEYAGAYRYMKEMLGIYHQQPLLFITPFWFWVQYTDAKSPRPDLRHSGIDTKGEKCVLLECEVPDEEILLSDYEHWYYALNKWYLPLDDEDNEKFDRLTDPIKRASLMRHSWSRMFDMEGFVHPTWSAERSQKRIQGVTWSIRKEWIIKATHFTAR